MPSPVSSNGNFYVIANLQSLKTQSIHVIPGGYRLIFLHGNANFPLFRDVFKRILIFLPEINRS